VRIDRIIREYYTSFKLSECGSKLTVYLHESLGGSVLCEQEEQLLHHAIAVVDHERPSTSDHAPLNFVFLEGA
jgi:hypothetical protein